MAIFSMEDHGGACCGISHLWSFNVSTPESKARKFNERTRRYEETGDNFEKILDNEIKEWIESIESDAQYDYIGEDEEAPWDAEDRPFSHAIEVVLTDTQMVRWAAALKKKGFKLVYRWLNDNSSNYCNLLIFNPNDEENTLDKLPYKW